MRGECGGRCRGGCVNSVHSILFCLLLVPSLAACSSLAALSPGANQAVAAAAPAQPVDTQSSNHIGSEYYPYPRQALTEMFKGSTDPVPAAFATPAGGHVVDNSVEANAYPYPKQTLFQSSSSQTPNVPHPPTTYTPSGQPYVPPQGQPDTGASVAAPKPVAATPPDDGPQTGAYPKQSLFDIFSNSSSK